MRRRSPTPKTASGRASVLVMLLLVIVAAGVAWWYLAPQSMPGWLARVIPPSPSAAPLLYKWRDDKGRLHVTDQPPADRAYETVRYDPNTNVVPGGSPKN